VLQPEGASLSAQLENKFSVLIPAPQQSKLMLRDKVIYAVRCNPVASAASVHPLDGLA